MATVIEIFFYTSVLSQIFIFHSVTFVFATENVSNTTNKTDNCSLINNIDGIVPILKTSIKTNITYYAGYGVLINPRMVIGIPHNDKKIYRYSIGTFNWTLNTAHITSDRYKIIFRIRNRIDAGVIHFKRLRSLDQWTDNIKFNFMNYIDIIILESPISGISPIQTLSISKLNDTINNQCVLMKIEYLSSLWNSSIFTSQTVPQKIFMDELELKDRLNHSVFSEATDELRIIKYFFNDDYYFLSTKDQKFNESERHNLRGSLLLCQSDNYPASFVLAGILIDTIDGFPLYNFISQNKKIQDQLDIIEGRQPKFDDNNLELILRSYVSQLYPENYK